MQYGGLLSFRNAHRNLAVPARMLATALVGVEHLYGPVVQVVSLTTPIPSNFFISQGMHFLYINWDYSFYLDGFFFHSHLLFKFIVNHCKDGLVVLQSFCSLGKNFSAVQTRVTAQITVLSFINPEQHSVTFGEVLNHWARR
jgi:hypothetical protein